MADCSTIVPARISAIGRAMSEAICKKLGNFLTEIMQKQETFSIISGEVQHGLAK